MNVMLLKKGDTGASAYEGWIALGHVGTEADYQDWLRMDGSTKEEVGVAAQLIADLKGGVSTTGDTLLKLYDLIVLSYEEQTVATIAARDAYNITHLPFSLFVLDDGDGLWALYKATTTGVGATFVKLSDYHLLNAIMTGQQIQIAYESNLDTNRYTDAEQAKLAAITGTNTGDQNISAMTHSNRVALDLVSGINTGDQDLSGFAIATAMVSALALKVDKVAGKVLSSNDYTDAERTKLGLITGTNTGDQNIAAMTHANRASLDLVSGTNTGDQDLSGLATSASVTLSLSLKVDKVTGKGLSAEDYTTTEKTKLQGIAPSAQKNSDITKAEIEAKLTGTNIVTHGHSLPLFSSYATPYTPADSDVILIEKAGVKFQWSWLGMKQALGVVPPPEPPPTGNSYYVAKTGLDSNTGTVDSPFLTITRGLQEAVAGDTVYVKTGTYSEYVRFLKSGTAGSPITLSNFGTDVVTIDALSTNVYCIYSYGQSFINVKGMRCKDATAYIINFENCSDILIDECWATHTSKTSVQCIVLDNGYNGVTRYNNYLIRNCITMNGDRGIAIWNNVSNAIVQGGEHSYNNVNVAVGGGYPLNVATRPTYITIDGVTAHHSVTSNMGTENCSNVTFRNNHCYMGGATGIQIETNSPNALLEGNLCEDNSRTWEYETGIWVYDSPNAIVRNNYVKNNQTGLRFRSAANFQAYNNIIENNNHKPTSSPTTHQTSGADFNQSTGTFYHNTLIGNTAAESALGSIFVYAAGVCTVVVKDNIIYNDGGSQDMVFEQSTVSDYNIVYNANRAINITVVSTGRTWTDYKSLTGQDSHSLNTNPLFISSSDFHLQSISPAIGAGVNVGITTDYTGATRVTNDIGAYKY